MNIAIAALLTLTPFAVGYLLGFRRAWVRFHRMYAARLAVELDRAVAEARELTRRDLDET